MGIVRSTDRFRLDPHGQHIQTPCPYCNGDDGCHTCWKGWRDDLDSYEDCGAVEATIRELGDLIDGLDP